MPFLPITAARACIRRAKRLLLLAASNGLPDTHVRNDLRRSALVMAVTAIDSYMHWLIYHRISDIRKEGDLPKALAGVDIEFDELAALADATIQARQQNKNTRPWVHVKRVIQHRLFQETFQGPEQLGRAFALAGIEKGLSRSAVVLGMKTEDVKARLKEIVRRRNLIVHEGDITRATRPRKLRYNEITQASVTADVTWIGELIKAFEKVVAGTD